MQLRLGASLTRCSHRFATGIRLGSSSTEPTATSAIATRKPEQIRDFVNNVVNKFASNAEGDVFQDRNLKFKILTECMKEFDVTIASPMLSQLTSADALSDLLCKAAAKEREPVCVQELPPNVHFE